MRANKTGAWVRLGLTAAAAGVLLTASCDRRESSPSGTGTGTGSGTGTGTGTGTGGTGGAGTRAPGAQNTPRPDATTPASPTTANTPPVTNPDASNTARNERDTNPNTPTPPDQGGSDSDRRITAEIRRAILDTDGLSTNARNCKIITNNGVVVLRGPVETQAERETIETKARAVTGVTSVTNELEVKRG